MYWRAGLLIGLGSLLNAVNAITITSPSGGTVDPTQSITVTWTHTSSDPPTFNLVFGSTDPASLIQTQTIGADISTDAGTFTIPANTLTTYGSQFVLKAQDGSGNVLSTSGSFDLAQGSFIETTDAQGHTTLISSSLANGAGATVTPITSGPQNSGAASATGTESQPQSTGTSSFQTSTKTTGRSTVASSSSSSSATASTSANAQPRLGSNSEMVLSAAGVLAGMVALLA